MTAGISYRPAVFLSVVSADGGTICSFACARPPRQPRAWTARIASGLAGAALAVSALGVPVATAQTTAPPQSAGQSLNPGRGSVSPPSGSNRGVSAGQGATADDENLPAAQPVAEPDLRRASDGEPDPGDSMADGANDPNAIPQDGDLSFPRDPALVVDGNIADGQPLPNRNQTEDPRDGNLRQADIVFGSDADTGNSPGTLLDVGPNGRPSLGFETDFDFVNGTNAQTRALRAFTAQPYDPLGINVGSFRVFPQLETSGVALGNVFRSNTGAKQDLALDFKPTIRAVSNWSSHLLDVTLSGDRSFHNQFPEEDDKAYSIDAKGRIDITKRINVELQAISSFSQEQRGSINDPSTAGSRVSANVSTLSAAYNERFNRLAIQVRGSITDNQFTGGVATTPERNFTSKDAALRASYELKGGFSVFAEEVGNWREYELAQSVDGIKRDSVGTKSRAGLALATTFWTGEASIGYARQDYADGRLAAVDGLTFDSALTWKPTAIDAVLFTATSQIGESTLAGTGGSVARSLGAEYRHNFARYWLVSGGVVLSTTNYDSASVTDRQWVATLGTEYYMSREVVLFGRYDHTDFTSSQVGRDYTDDQLRIGVRLRQ